MSASTAWQNYLAAKNIQPTDALIEAFFTGYKEGMSYGMEEGRKLCVQLMNVKSSAPADENSNS